MKTILIFLSVCLLGCTPPVKNTMPLIASSFPSVEGETLEGNKVRIPRDYLGQPVVYLIGYVQKSQFDIDRWILGLTQLGAKAKIVELPTIPGLLPGLASGSIQEGMKRGIPKEDWASVVTVFKDGGILVSLTGNENPNNARVILVNAAGNILWFTDKGYSAGQVMELNQRIRDASLP